MKSYTIAGIIVLAGLVGLMLVSMLDEATYFSDFETAKKEGKTVHVIGRWVNRTDARFEPENNYNSFFVEDTNKYVQEVHYYGALMGDLSAADKIDIVGKYNKDIFVANKIHMKCPSKYNEGGSKLTEANSQGSSM